jgi:hypothetical protein
VKFSLHQLGYRMAQITAGEGEEYLSQILNYQQSQLCLLLFALEIAKTIPQICMKICYCLGCLAKAAVPTLLFISRRVAAIARGIPITIGPMIRNSGGSPGIILAIIIVP